MEGFENTNLTDINQEQKCHNCGAMLKFAPGTHHLKCEYCNAENEIKQDPDAEPVNEIDYHQFLKEGLSNEPKEEIVMVKCTGCGAEESLPPNITSSECAFCGTSLIVKNGSTESILRPKSVLPFKIERKQAFEQFRKWIKGLWFAPSNLKKAALNIEKLHGMYMPYWTFDSNTHTTYTGQRGIRRTEYYTTTDSDGKTVQRTRTVTDWYPAFGSVNNDFDDVLVPATKALPQNYLDDLEPWDLENLVPFADSYLSGFQTQKYQVGLEDGFDIAKVKMERVIETSVRRDIGGDEQRIISMNPDFRNITFKHTLMPIWISSYKYKNKVYRFIVNARTGEVRGERPWSWIKITLAVLAAAAVVYILNSMSQGA